MMTLEELTALENEWLRKHPKGSLEDMHALCQETGVYEAWRRIFELYVIEARKGDLEALKRALFLYWYACSEPSEFSGIPALDDGLTAEVLGMVNETAKKGRLDIELKWMLPYYYYITDWYIERLEGFCELKEVSKANREAYMPDWSQPACYESLRGLQEALARKLDLDPWEELCLKSSFSNRGQMGYYWKSVQDNLIERPRRENLEQ
ncbi:MAG: hypothetical protein JSW66_20345 [Phycisphaerales bacterium]|nr:MAG: hypothetical protein JSW66_20345 [Phycisphaerales bacterium]